MATLVSSTLPRFVQTQHGRLYKGATPMSWYVVKEGKRIFTAGKRLGNKIVAGSKINLTKRQAQSFKDSIEPRSKEAKK